MVGVTEEHETVLNLIDEQELVDLAVAMGNIKAPSGYEQPMADFVLQWLKQMVLKAPCSNRFEMAVQIPSASSAAQAAAGV